MTRFGQRDALIRKLPAEARKDCLADAGVAPGDVDCVYVSNMASGEFDSQTEVMKIPVHELSLTCHVCEFGNCSTAAISEAT